MKLLLVEESGELVVAMEDGGVWRSSTLGASWNSYSDGLSVLRCFALARTEGDAPQLLVGTQSKGVFRRELETGLAALQETLLRTMGERQEAETKLAGLADGGSAAMLAALT